jgi:dihydropteroate synthase
VKLLGILNITPDSFSDGGQYNAGDTALARAEQLVADGASVIDIGAESTRPHATPLTAAEEWERLSPILPLLKQLLTPHGVVMSVDTRHAATAARAIDLGADWINDVSGCDDPAMRKVIAGSDVSVVIMHHLGIPANPAMTLPEASDVIATISEWTQKKLLVLQDDNITPDRIILDPGIGFGKTAEQSWEIIRHIAALKRLGLPLLVGHSRKSFLTYYAGTHEGNRDIETYAVTSYLAAQGVEYARVHDVAGNKKVLRVMEGIGDFPNA